MRHAVPALLAAALAVWPACARAPESPAAILAASPACHGAAPAPPPPGPAAGAPGLLPGLGVAGFAVERATPEAARYFAQGVELFHSFDAPEAIRSLRWAQVADPDCAMCAWAEGWARGPTINYPVEGDGAAAARTAALRAQRLGGSLSPKAQGLIAALVQRYPARAGRAAVDGAAYARAMEALAARFPDDDAIVTETADALLIASGHAWTDLAHAPAQGEVGRARALLERVIARSPDYAPAIHFDIHLMEWTGEPARAVAAADRLGGLAPAAGHLVHMPSHLYYRLGRYEDAAASNARAVAADRAHVAALKPPGGVAQFSLHAHNLAFGLASTLMDGDAAGALAFADAVHDTFGDGPGVGLGAYLAWGRYGDPARVLALPRPTSALAELFWRFARGEALARRDDAAGVAAEVRAIAALKASGRDKALNDDVMGLPQLALQGRAALLAHRPVEAVAAFRKAADLRDRVDRTPDPPIWPLPPRRSLAAALLLSGDVEGARAEAARSLVRDVGDPLALHVLAEAQRRAGSPAAAKTEAAARRGWRGPASTFRLELI